MPTEILALSWTVQVALASGYAAYIIAYRGIRSHHSAQDTLFSVLVFSLIASTTLWWLRTNSPIFAGLSAFLCCIATASLWRSVGAPFLNWCLRKGKISWADDTPSAWARLQENRSVRVSQIAVWLNDGSRLICEDVAKFDGLPYAPFILGTNGDVLIYVSHTRPKDGDPKEQPTTLVEGAGARVTYIPASQIARVTIRHEAKISLRPPAAETPAASSKA